MRSGCTQLRFTRFNCMCDYCDTHAFPAGKQGAGQVKRAEKALRHFRHGGVCGEELAASLEPSGGA